jgi:hypothetical protein
MPMIGRNSDTFTWRGRPRYWRELQSTPEHSEALDLLRERYPQYRSMALESRPVIKSTPTHVVGWVNNV